MLTFIKRLLGFAPNPVKTQEEVKAIFVPQNNSAKTPEAQYIPPAKPNTVAKVRAITETGPEAIKAAHAQKSANKRRRQHRGNKGAGGSVAKVGVSPSSITEGKTKGGNNTVKPAQVAKAKPAKPKAPVKK